MSTILVPVDYSEHALRVLEFAGKLAQRLNASLCALYVWETMPHFPPELCVTTTAGPRCLDEIVKESAVREMKEFLGRAELPASLPIESQVESGAAAAKIVDYIPKCGADLVVVGTHGRGGVKHWVLGSVAERVVRLSPVPVITVPERRREVG
jgi:nucleotide-binding universal stress UspA family protein